MNTAPKLALLAARALSAVARRSFPAWIDASERGVAFSATTVMPRVRDSLVLRVVHRPKHSAPRRDAHAFGAR